MKRLLIYVLVLISGNLLNAQHTGLYVGVNAAFQNTRIANSDDQNLGGELDFDNTFKSAFGFDLGYRFTTRTGIQTGLIYSQQGQNYSTNGNPIGNYKTELTYLKIPVLFCYRLRPEKKLSFLLQGGFQLSMLSEAKSSRKGVYGAYSPALVDVKSYYTSLPIELVVAVGLQYTMGKFCLNALIRPDYSLSDIEEIDQKPGLRGPTSNFTIGIPQLGIQYFFK